MKTDKEAPEVVMRSHSDFILSDKESHPSSVDLNTLKEICRMVLFYAVVVFQPCLIFQSIPLCEQKKPADFCVPASATLYWLQVQ